MSSCPVYCSKMIAFGRAEEWEPLASIFDSKGRSSDGQTPDAERASLQTRWKAWAATHRAEIQAGTKVPVDKDLIPSNWKME